MLFVGPSSSSLRRSIVVSVMFNCQSRLSAGAVARPQPCEVCPGAQGKNRSISIVVALLLILGSSSSPRDIEAAAVDIVILFVAALRPLAEWNANQDRHRGRAYPTTAQWLYNLVPRVNLWRPQHTALLACCEPLVKMHVHGAALLRFLLDPAQLVLPLNFKAGQVTSNIRNKINGFGRSASDIVFSLRPNFSGGRRWPSRQET